MQRRLIDGIQSKRDRVNNTTHRVLYFEDSKLDAELMKLVFENIQGVELTIAVDATVGLLLAEVDRPDLILMDIMLPDMNGVDVAKILQNLPNTHDVPVIAVSASSMPAEHTKPNDLGFVAYFTKPIEEASMISAVESALDKVSWVDN